MKNSKNFLKLSIILIVSSVLFNGCSTNATTDGEELLPEDDFTKKAMLENLTDNIIIPSFINLNDKIGDLKTSSENFINDITTENLSDLRKKWLRAYKAWQYVEMFNIGKAEEIFYPLKMNTYPTDVDRIHSNIESGLYDLVNNDNNLDAQGFPALDYMLYGLNGDSLLVIDKYLSSEGNKYIDYLDDLVTHITENTNLVTEYWNTNRNAFVNSYSNTATSNFNMLTNDFIYYYEKGLRANKIGIPAGVFPGGTHPNKVEAYYHRNVSKELALGALDACKKFFIGESFLSNQTGASLKTYLDHRNQNNTLSNIIISKFEKSKEKIEMLDNNFALQIETNNIEMLYAYDAIQEGVVKLKTDMLHSLNISVDYFDADGD